MRRAKDQFSVPVMLGCMVSSFCAGIVYLWSVFKDGAIAYYGWEEGLVNLISAFMLFGFCLGHTIGGNLQDRIGPRWTSMAGMIMFGGGLFLSSLIPASGSVLWFYITYCALGGLGSGFVFTSAVNGLQKWMPHRRGLATGLVTASQGLTAAFTPLIQILLDHMPNLPMAMRALAGILFFFGFLACLFIRLPEEAYLQTLPPPSDVIARGSLTKESLPPVKAMRTLPFWLMFASLFLYNGTWNMLTPLIKSLGRTRGLGEAAVTLAVSLTGITQACGRFSMSTLSDKIGRFRSLVILCIITLACALSLTFAGGGFYLVIVLLTAFGFGGPAAVFPAFTTDLFGPKYSGGNYGVIILGLGISSVVFTSVSNWLYAATGTYTLSFLMGAVSVVITLLCQIKIHRILNQVNSVQE